MHFRVGSQKDGIAEARATILEIVKSDASDCVKQDALKTLTEMCRVENTNISNNVFQAEDKN